MMKISEITKLGKDLKLFDTFDCIGKGFPVFLPKGAIMIKKIQDEVENKLMENHYLPVKTPCLSNFDIYKIEDRYQTERGRLFQVENTGEEKLYLKPYLSLFHCTIYNKDQYSYKDLPIKFFETSSVFRNEKDIKGLIKTRQFTITDCSIFEAEKNLEQSLKEIVSIQNEIVNKLGLQVRYEVQNWDTDKKEEYIGTIDEWNMCIEKMENALRDDNLAFTENNKAPMYGPAIKLFYGDNYFAKIQIDFEITHRFDVKFHNKENEAEFPKFIHSTIVGSYENLIGILIDKYQGEFPEWLQ